jgi:hypothetical protein
MQATVNAWDGRGVYVPALRMPADLRTDRSEDGPQVLLSNRS